MTTSPTHTNELCWYCKAFPITIYSSFTTQEGARHDLKTCSEVCMTQIKEDLDRVEAHTHSTQVKGYRAAFGSLNERIGRMREVLNTPTTMDSLQLDLFDIQSYDTSGDMAARFTSFHLKNPHVFSALHKLSSKAKALGWKKGSINLFFERLRWDYAIKTQGSKYKLCNDHRAFYARVLMAYDPDLEGFFRTRGQSSTYTPDLEALGLDPTQIQRPCDVCGVSFTPSKMHARGQGSFTCRYCYNDNFHQEHTS